MCCCNKENWTRIHVKNVMMIGSKEVGRAVEESNVMDSISVVVFDTRLTKESDGCVLLTSKAVGIFRWNA